ncbi:hypothetical protein P9281_34685 [Caballeronia sp. LP003]|uniref:hypothetical protein n=1 Tax=Caballeronia sp. LP003 TaxID=3038551 RepID=UPI0028600FD7|nr:hypothetical protein [Caballeronia sp. LP003]MDR5791696.1 hypothetical protein [Caballeronia sp. LP003]
MHTNPIFDAPGRDGQIARALNVALHALSVHDRMTGTMEGETVMLDFGPQIRQLRAALELLGVNRDETLPFQNPER